jgi:hypothetical protein
MYMMVDRAAFFAAEGSICGVLSTDVGRVGRASVEMRNIVWM